MYLCRTHEPESQYLKIRASLSLFYFSEHGQLASYLKETLYNLHVSMMKDKAETEIKLRQKNKNRTEKPRNYLVGTSNN